MSAELIYVRAGTSHVDVARELFQEYQRELDVDLCFQSFEEELANLPGKYELPKGALLVAQVDGEWAGCGAFRPFEGETCELKRFYVRPKFRRSGIAAQMLEKLLAQARKSGYHRVILDTLERLGPANAFYLKHGFEYIDPYYENPEPDVVFLGRSIRPDAPQELQPFLDYEGRLTRFPMGKGGDKLMMLFMRRAMNVFRPGVDYTEKEVNALLNTVHTFNDPVTLRRMLVDYRFLNRTDDCSKYWKTPF